MQKPLTAVVIRRSSHALGAHLALVVAVGCYVASFSSGMLAAIWLAGGLVWAVWKWRRQSERCWLRQRTQDDRRQWELSFDGRHFHEVRCRLVRLGPALTGIRLGDETVWLYRDSLSGAELRRLREALAGNFDCHRP